MPAMTPTKFLLAVLAGGTMLAILVRYLIYRDDGVREQRTSPAGAATDDNGRGATQPRRVQPPPGRHASRG